MLTKNKGYTFIEILMTIVIISICFLPLIQMFSTSLEQTGATSDLSVGRYLAQEGMERIKNQNLTVAQLKEMGDVWDPPKGVPPVMIDKKGWRILRKINSDMSPLEVKIQVYKEDDLERVGEEPMPFVEVVTLVEDLDWQ